MSKRDLVWIGVAGALLAGGCGSSEGAEGSSAAAASGEAVAPGEAALIAGAASGPVGYQWAAASGSGFAGVQVPTGEGWITQGNGSGGEYGNETLGITVMLQEQASIPAEAREMYMDSFVEVNQRDAPQYAVTSRTTGTVGGNPAGLVDGAFNNGQAMVTRDYLVFAHGKVSIVMVRGPEARLAEVQAVADHVANSIH